MAEWCHGLMAALQHGLKQGSMVVWPHGVALCQHGGVAP